MNKTLLFLPLFSIAIACGNDPQRDADVIERHDPLEAFADFPDSLFHGIYWGQAVDEAAKNLYLNNFEQIDSSGAQVFFKSADSTRVVLPEAGKVRELKLVLRSKAYLTEKDKLLNGFRLCSTSAQQAPEFCVFTYDLSRFDFKLTAFIQPAFIRLNFEQKRSH